MTSETHIDGGNRRRVQRVRIKPGGWTKARRTAFLKALAETCNVSLSTELAGMRGKSAYDLRKRDPAFARLWEEALDIGYDRLETLLLQRAIEGVNDVDVPALVDDAPAGGGDAPADPPRGHHRPGSGVAPARGRNDTQLALAMLNRREALKAGKGLGRGQRKSMTADEVDVLLAKKLDALARQRGRQP